MTTVSTEDPQFQRAIQACAVALRRMADYEIEPSLHRRMQVLGERKEFLSHEEQSAQRLAEIEGITAHGRATVVRLQMNHPNLVSIRRLLVELGLPWRAEV